MFRPYAPVLALLTVCCAGGSRQNQLGSASQPEPRPTLSVSSSQLARMDIDDIAPARRETREVRPCVYAGSFKLESDRSRAVHATLSDAELGPLLHFSAAELAELELPDQARGFFSIRMSWPIAVSGQLSSKHLPLELRERIEVQPPHLWLSPGARVYGWSKAPGFAHVARQRTQGLAYESPVAVEREVPCATLALAGSIAKPPLGKWQMDERTLFSAPDRSSRLETIESITSTPLVEVLEVVEREQTWVRVRGFGSSTTFTDERYAPWDFEAWTPGVGEPISPSEGPRQPRPKRGPPTHQTTRELACYILPGRAKLGTIPSGVPVRVVSSESGFVAVQLPGIQYALYVSEAELRAAASAVGP